MASSNFAPRNSPPLPAQKRYSFNNTPFIKLYHCYHHISTIFLIPRQQFKSNFYKHFYSKPVFVVIILLKISSFLFYLYLFSNPTHIKTAGLRLPYCCFSNHPKTIYTKDLQSKIQNRILHLYICCF